MTTDIREPRDRGETAENLAMIAYGLLFASIFFAGAPALIAVVIAYSQRQEASPGVAQPLRLPDPRLLGRPSS